MHGEATVTTWMKWPAMPVKSEVTLFAISIASGMIFGSAGDSYMTIRRVIAQHLEPRKHRLYYQVASSRPCKGLQSRVTPWLGCAHRNSCTEQHRVEPVIEVSPYSC